MANTEQINKIKGLAASKYSGDYHIAACHVIYGEGVVAMGGGRIPSGMDMKLIDEAAGAAKAKKRTAPKVAVPKASQKKAPAKKAVAKKK